MLSDIAVSEQGVDWGGTHVCVMLCVCVQCASDLWLVWCIVGRGRGLWPRGGVHSKCDMYMQSSCKDIEFINAYHACGRTVKLSLVVSMGIIRMCYCVISNIIISSLRNFQKTVQLLVCLWGIQCIFLWRYDCSSYSYLAGIGFFYDVFCH